MKVSQLVQINKIKQDSFESEFDRNVELLSVYLDIDIDEIEEMDINIFDSNIRELNNVLTKSYPIAENAIPMTELKLSNFIDLERYLSSSDNFTKVCAILHRGFKLNEWGHKEYEPMNFNINERAEMFDELDIDCVLGNVNEYMKFRQSIMNAYKTIFNDGVTDEKVETDNLSPAEIKQLEKDLEEEKQKERYNWELFVYWLCDNRLVDFEKVLEFPVIYALNLASMKKLINE